MSKSNEDLQKDVQNAIKWEPLLNAAEIGVTAKDGVVTLTGIVSNYSKKTQAENAAKNVTGVKAVVENIEVNYVSEFDRNDTEIANEVLNSWRLNWSIPKEKIKVKVEKGWVTLEGELEWNYQRQAAKEAVENLTGVKGVTNDIIIKSNANDRIEKSAVENAFKRSWTINAEEVNVDVSGNKVKLTGSVSSLFQKDEAARLAWNAPGVRNVENELMVDTALDSY